MASFRAFFDPRQCSELTSSAPCSTPSAPSRALIAGGGAPEVHVSRLLAQYAQSLKGMEAYCFQAFAEALEIIPTTLAENAGLNPIAIVTELRNRHALGERTAGINVRKGQITNILEENVLQRKSLISLLLRSHPSS